MRSNNVGMNFRILTGVSALLLATACNKNDVAPRAANVAEASSSARAGAEPASTAPNVLATSGGAVRFHPINHATFYMEVGDKVVWLDPTNEKPLDTPKADVILITDIHPDHLVPDAVDRLRKQGTVVVGPRAVADKLPGTEVLDNGAKRDLGFIEVEAVPMYNLQRGPKPGALFHDKGRGNGYVITAFGKRIYVSGDTECTSEMKSLQQIDVAFVCMNLPYTMPPAEAAECVKAFHPAVLYPYHYRDSNLAELDEALKGSGVEVRKLTWY